MGWTRPGSPDPRHTGLLNLTALISINEQGADEWRSSGGSVSAWVEEAGLRAVSG